METFTIIADEHGGLKFIYDDALLPLAGEGLMDVRRASHVEPAPGGGWNADMTPVGGPPCLGRFATRGEALAAEREWLNRTLTGGGLGA